MDIDQEHIVVRNAKTIRSAMSSDYRLNEILGTQREPEWVGDLYSSVALAVGDLEIEFATVGATREGNGNGRVFGVSGVAFAGELIVTFELTGAAITGGVQESRVRAYTWAAVESYDAWSETPVTSQGGDDWPGEGTITLRFRGGDTAKVPAGRPNSDQRETTEAFLFALPRRISGSSLTE